MTQLLHKLTCDFPELTFMLGKEFYWSPQKQAVYHPQIASESDIWSLLHETSHAILNHQSFQSDFQLLALEREAWEHAKKLARNYNIAIDNDHIEDCLDTYRDWLHKRSVCPNCSVKSLQAAPNRYQCLNCATAWHVSPSQRCRPYRRTARRAQIAT